MPMDTSFTIDSIRLRLLELPFQIPFRISGGICLNRKSVVVELDSGGATGYGESAPNEVPFYSGETLGSVLALYRDLYLPRLAGKSFPSLEAFDEELARGVRGNRFARAGFENAAWDLLCRKNRLPLVKLIEEKLLQLGITRELARPRPFIESGVSVGIPGSEEKEPLSTLRRWIRGYLEEGYRRVKIKIQPGWEIEACEAARAEVGPGFLLWTDANASFELEAHRPVLRAMDRFGLAFHEQPLHHDDLLDHARLGKEIRTPICFDESLKSARVARQALEVNASRLWNIKVQRVGGLLEALRIYKVAAEAGSVALWAGTMPESGIGSQAAIALAAFPLFQYPTDLEPSSRWYAPGHDPIELVMGRDGTIAVPENRGLAELIDWDRYRRFSRPIEF
ncbi:MAG: o-succinylbenzoate synthase [Planctomycetes bacterium]|nr:o-succinylbenzoate synthase [Planctomycetota bacterium]